MALCKPIKQSNGITLSYHMIAKMDIESNQQITILVNSYLDEEARQYEKDYAAGLIEGEPQFPYYDYEYINIEYVEGIKYLDGNTMNGAYNLLKKCKPELADAEDV